MGDDAGGAVTAPRSGEDPAGRGFWLGLAAGTAVMGYGVWGLVQESDATRPGDLARWFAGGLLVHDLAVAPLVSVAAALVGRVVRGPWRAPVCAGLGASAVLVAIGWPALRGYGSERVPDNPSVQPLDEATALAWVVGAVWVLVLTWGVLATRRAQFTRRVRPSQ
jgi:hypothetical protein